MTTRNRVLNALSYFVASLLPKAPLPEWMLERAARHYYGRSLGP